MKIGIVILATNAKKVINIETSEIFDSICEAAEKKK